MGKTYLQAIKEGYIVLSTEQIKLYNPNVLSRRKFVISATPPKDWYKK